MTRQKVFDLAAAVDRMLLPDQHHRSSKVMQQMSKKSDYFLPADRFTTGLQAQLDLAFRRAHAQSTNPVQALIVFQTGTNGWRLPAWCPGARPWRDQGKARFIEKNERCTEFTPLFLFAARQSVSNGQSLSHRAPNCDAVVSDNSSRAIAGYTTRC